MKHRSNYYTYNTKNSSKVSGFFNVYQARNGGIYLTMGNRSILLGKAQISELGIDVYQLEEFNHSEYCMFYKDKE
jgi:hypothetical protein